ncbi:Fic family protein, partial [bacterium]
LERFIHGEPTQTPTLIKTGLAHAQFESIHPFLDGNGRVGRLLISLILTSEGALAYPLLYLSLYFKQRRTEYYDALMDVRLRGRWEDWLAFYLAGVEEVAKESARTCEGAVKVFDADRRKVAGLGKGSPSALKLHEFLKKRCLLTLATAQKETGLSLPTVTQAMGGLLRLGVVREITGRRRQQVFAYHAYWKLIAQGMG